jgi:hypothetical protein
MMESALVRAAGQERRSAKARAGIVVVQDLVLEYDGPKDPNVLCEDTTFRLRCGVQIVSCAQGQDSTIGQRHYL